MRSLLATLTRLMPLVFFIIVAITLIQFFSQHPVRPEAFWHWLRNLGWVALAIVAVLLWVLVVVGLIHERRARAGDLRHARRSWFMDILDRLTNRQVLEDRLRKEAEPEYLDAEDLARKLKSRVIGQDGVCEDVAAQIRRRLALRQRGKPVGVFLLAGPPGTGKTYLAKVLAETLDRKLVHLDMTQFARGGAASTQLFGSSKGYVGSDTYGKLTAALRETPDALVLLDEFEKAHPEVHKNFLTAWNDGFITEASDGKHVSTTRTIFIATTNAAIDELTELATRYASAPDELRRSATQALLNAGFAPELLNRIDRIFVFKPLQGLDIARVSALEIERMIKNYGLDVLSGGIDPELLLQLVRRQQGSGSAASSRDLVRVIEETIADSLIEAKRQGAKRVSLQEANGVITAVPEGPQDKPSSATPRDYYHRTQD